MSKKIVLAGACRTAIGKMGGGLSTTPAVELGALVIKEALQRAGCTNIQNSLAVRKKITFKLVIPILISSV